MSRRTGSSHLTRCPSASLRRTPSLTRNSSATVIIPSLPNPARASCGVRMPVHMKSTTPENSTKPGRNQSAISIPIIRQSPARTIHISIFASIILQSYHFIRRLPNLPSAPVQPSKAGLNRPIRVLAGAVEPTDFFRRPIRSPGRAVHDSTFGGVSAEKPPQQHNTLINRMMHSRQINRPVVRIVRLILVPAYRLPVTNPDRDKCPISGHSSRMKVSRTTGGVGGYTLFEQYSNVFKQKKKRRGASAQPNKPFITPIFHPAPAKNSS